MHLRHSQFLHRCIYVVWLSSSHPPSWRMCSVFAKSPVTSRNYHWDLHEILDHGHNSTHITRQRSIPDRVAIRVLPNIVRELTATGVSCALGPYWWLRCLMLALGWIISWTLDMDASVDLLFHFQHKRPNLLWEIVLQWSRLSPEIVETVRHFSSQFAQLPVDLALFGLDLSRFSIHAISQSNHVLINELHTRARFFVQALS